MPIPPSTYSSKTLLSELLTPEIFVVLVIRLRVAAQFDPGSMPEDWRAGLRAAGVAREGADAFDLLMHLFSSVLLRGSEKNTTGGARYLWDIGSRKGIYRDAIWKRVATDETLGAAIQPSE